MLYVQIVYKNHLIVDVIIKIIAVSYKFKILTTTNLYILINIIATFSFFYSNKKTSHDNSDQTITFCIIIIIIEIIYDNSFKRVRDLI